MTVITGVPVSEGGRQASVGRKRRDDDGSGEPEGRRCEKDSTLQPCAAGVEDGRRGRKPQNTGASNAGKGKKADSPEGIAGPSLSTPRL